MCQDYKVISYHNVAYELSGYEDELTCEGAAAEQYSVYNNQEGQPCMSIVPQKQSLVQHTAAHVGLL